MNEDTSKLEDKDFEIPCQLHAVTEFDMSEEIPAKSPANISIGGAIRHDLIHEPVEFDFSQERNG